jgi:hypothetical protein
LATPHPAEATQGLLNQISVLFPGPGVAATLLLKPLRHHLPCQKLYAGGVVAVRPLPNIVMNDRPGCRLLSSAALSNT